MDGEFSGYHIHNSVLLTTKSLQAYVLKSCFGMHNNSIGADFSYLLLKIRTGVGE